MVDSRKKNKSHFLEIGFVVENVLLMAAITQKIQKLW